MRGGPRDLKSWLAWDPYRLRYGNYIDAMAMLRKSVVEEAGGYTSDRRLYGWEDFALWCALADRGLRGRAVPAIVARYRASLQSMISITNIDGGAAWTALTRALRDPERASSALSARIGAVTRQLTESCMSWITRSQ